MAVNKAIILGFVGQAPKLSSLNNGSKVATFSVATTEKGYTTQAGVQVQEKTEWHSIVAWGKLAEIVEKWVAKGSRVYLEGKMRTRSYDDKNGTKKYVTEIQAEVLQLLNNITSSEQQPSDANVAPTGKPDDLPF